MKFLEDKFLPIAAKLGSQKHLMCIPFIMMMPMTILGSIAILINNIHSLFGPEGFNLPVIQNGYENFIVTTGIQDIMNAVSKGTINMLSILLVVALAFQMAKQMKGDLVATPIVALAVYLALIPSVQTLLPSIDTSPKMVQILTEELEGGGIAANKLDSNGLLIAMILTFIVAEIFIRLSRREKLKIKLPKGVPPTVANAFSVLIPGIFTMLIVCSLGIYIEKIFGMNLWDMVTKFIQAPLTTVADNGFTAFIVPFMTMLLWCFGLHGGNIMEAITAPVFTPMLIENMNAYNNGELPPNVINGTDMFCSLGGSGCTIALIIAILLVGKVKSEKQVAKMSIAPGLFEINEPMVFGIPIVMNPIYMIPYISGTVLCSLLSYYMMSMNWIERVCLNAPWVTPPILKQFFATGGGIRAAVFTAVLIVILTLIYMPFVILSNHQNASDGINE